MKIKWLIPPQMNLEAIVRSIPRDWKFDASIYFLGSAPIPDATEADLFIYSGATDGIYSLSTSELKRLRDHAKVINLCVGGSDTNWHPFLEAFIENDVFDLMWNIDGSTEWPRRWFDITTLPPIDPEPYATPNKKTILCGFTGEPTPGRQYYINELGQALTQFHRNASYGDYDNYAGWIKSCEFYLNMNFFNEYDKVKTVNMKTIEAGLAGAVLLDRRGGLSSKYFVEDEEYVAYDRVDEIQSIIFGMEKSKCDWVVNNQRKRIQRDYSAKWIWTEVFRALNCLDKVFAV